MQTNLRISNAISFVLYNSLIKTFGLQKKLGQRFFYLCLIILSCNSLTAQTTVSWNFTNAAFNVPSSAIPNLTIDTFKRGNSLGTITTAIRTTTSGSTTYANASGGNNIGNAAQTGASFSTSTNAFFEITLTPASGYTVQVSGISFGSRSTNTGPAAYRIRSSADTYGSDLGSGTLTVTSNPWALYTPTFTSVTSAAGTALTLRIYGWNGTGTAATGTVNWRVDDVSLTVTVASAEVAPAAPTSGGNQTACVGGSIPNLSASAPNGAVVDWYSAASGGSVLSGGTATNSFATGQTTAGTYNYFAESRNNPGTLKSATRTQVTLTINPVVTPSISASVDDNSPTPGQTINFSTIPTNGGTSPTYQWYKNSTPISGATASTYSTSSNYASGDVFYVEMTSNAPCTTPSSLATSGNITITIDNSACNEAPPTATATATATNICSGGSSSFNLTNLGAKTGYTFQWQTSTTQNGTYSDLSGETNSTLSQTNITSTLWYRCVVTCAAASLSTPSNPVQASVTANVTPSVTILSSQSPSCAGANVTYTPTPVNGGPTPTYAWYRVRSGNTTNVANTTLYTSNNFQDGDEVYVIITSNFACLNTPTATSANALQNVTPSAPASVSVTSSANPACASANVTFTANPTNGGTNPTYQWYNGASPIIGATSSTYSSSALTNNASISVIMTSNANCATGSPATSNVVVQGISANVTPSLTIASNNNPVCISGNATFNINPVNPGTTPIYAWYLNGNLVDGQTGTTYTLTNVNNQDSVWATMTSSITCVTTASATSNKIIQTVLTAQVTPSVTITASPSTTVTPGTNITFIVTPTNGGTTPTYQWRLNGNNTVTTATYSSINFQNNDVISCVMTSNHTCATQSTATSNNLTVNIVNGVPFTPGNLIVYRVGDSANNLVNTGNPVFLSEFTTSGQLIQNIRLTKTIAGQNSIFANGTSTSEGFLNLSVDAKNIVVPGYYSNTTQSTSLSTSNSSSVNRVVCLVDRNINLDTTTRLTDWASGNTARSAIANGNNIWVSGGAGGVRFAAKGSTTSTQLSTSVANLRTLNIFNGQLYTTSQSGAFRMATVGSGTPTSGTTNTITNLPGLPTATGSPYGFYFADLSSSVSGYDVLYYADDAANTIVKYSLVNGTWTLNNTITATAIRGLTGITTGNSVTLYGTTGGSSNGASGTAASRVYSFTDNTGYNTNMTGTISVLVDRNTASFIGYRGITFTPTGFTTQPQSKTVCTGNSTSLSCAMISGSSPSIYSYQWQVSFNNGGNWNNITNTGIYSNATTATLNISETNGLNGNQYRCQVTYMSNYILNSDIATLTVLTTVVPSVSISTATNTVCSGSTVTFNSTGTNTGASPIYQWRRNGNNLTTGNSITFAPNTLNNGDIISCILSANNTCQTVNDTTSNFIVITVQQSPATATIFNGLNNAANTTNTVTYCSFGTQPAFYVANSLRYGTWSVVNPAILTLNNSNSSTGLSSSGVVNVLSNGTTTLNYTLPSTIPGNNCTSVSSITIKVAKQNTPDAISGATTLCVGDSKTYATTSTGGVWGITGRGIINNAGIASFSSAGLVNITYTITNVDNCSASSILPINIVAIPAVPNISFVSGQNPFIGAPSGSWCRNRSFILTGSPSNGIWSSTLITTTPNGTPSTTTSVSTGTTTGPASVSYEISNAGGCKSTRTFRFNVFACATKGQQTESRNTQWTVYPNPAKDIINISYDKLSSGTIIVTDLYGKQILTQPVSLGNNIVNISKFAKGIYFVSTLTETEKTTKKVILE